MQRSSLTVVDDDTEQEFIAQRVADAIIYLRMLITNLIVSRVFFGSAQRCKNSVEEYIFDQESFSQSVLPRHSFADTDDTTPFIVLLVNALNLLLELHSIPLPSTLAKGHARSLDIAEGEWSNEHGFTPFTYAVFGAISSRHSYSLQLVAINGLVDLLALALQQNSGNSSTEMSPSSEVPEIPKKCNTLDIIKPFDYSYLAFLERKTCLYETLTSILWSGIASKRPGCHEQSAELLFVLHQISPRPTLCEDVICRQLVSQDLSIRHEAFRRFARFWHISRGIDRRRVRRLRTFNRCLLVFLEALGRTNDQVYPIVIAWVEQVIRDNDIYSVLDPLFLLLLHPDTARIYVEKLVVVSGENDPETVPSSSEYGESEDFDNRIVAVASENGQVRFMTSKHQNSQRAESNPRLSGPALVRYQNGRFSSLKTNNQQQQQQQQSRSETPTQMSLVTNPFEDALDDGVGESESMKTTPSLTSTIEGSSMSEMLKKAKRLENGQFVEQESPNADTQLEEFAENLVEGVMRQVFLVITGEDPEGEETSSATPLPPPDASENEMYKTNLFTVDVPYASDSTVHPLASHLLVYYETFDTTRVHHAIKLLSNLISASPQSLCSVMAMTTLSAGEDISASSTAASFGDGESCTTQSRQLRMLLAKHRCSLLGRNFYSDNTDSLSTVYRNLNYLELTLHTLLHFLRSIHPVKESTASEDHLANTQVQIAAAHLLAIIVTTITKLLRLPQPPVAGFAECITKVMASSRLVNILVYCVGITLAMPNLVHSSATIAMKVAMDALQQRAVVVSADTQLIYHLKLLVLLRCCAELELSLAGCNPKLRGSFEKTPTWYPSRDPKSSRSVAEFVLRFHNERPLVYQPLLLFCVNYVQRNKDLADFHPSWLQLTISLLPSLCRATSDYVQATVSNICSSMLWLADAYDCGSSKETLNLPTDYLLSLLDSLSSMCNFTFSTENTSTSVRPIVNSDFSLLSINDAVDMDGGSTGDSSFQLSSAAKRTFTWSSWFRDKKSKKVCYRNFLSYCIISLPTSRNF